jgi:hypothetical protein
MAPGITYTKSKKVLEVALVGGIVLLVAGARR